MVPRTFAVVGVKALGWSSALVPSSAIAVTGNLTVTRATSAGYVSVGPTIAALPKTSTLNVAAGANMANGVTVALSAEQFSWLKQAIRNQREVWDILVKLQRLTAEHALQNLASNAVKYNHDGGLVRFELLAFLFCGWSNQRPELWMDLDSAGGLSV